MVSWARGFNGALAQAAPISPSEQSSVAHFLGFPKDPLSVVSWLLGRGGPSATRLFGRPGLAGPSPVPRSPRQALFSLRGACDRLGRKPPAGAGWRGAGPV